MVAAQQSESFWVSQFEQDEVSDGLDTRRTSIHVVAKEQIVRIGHFATDSKKFNHVKELSVDIPDNRDWGLNGGDIALHRQDFFDLRANYFDCDLL